MKTYSFNVTKSGEIFDLLVFYGQIVIPKGLKTLPLEHRKSIFFCKFHNFLGHKTLQCVLFKDLVKNALKDGRLEFYEKKKSRQEGGPNPKVEEALFPEPVDIFMVDITKSTKGDEPEFEVKMKGVFPKVEEEIIDF